MAAVAGRPQKPEGGGPSDSRQWAKCHLEAGSELLSDGLACFRSVTKAGCHHTAVVAGGKHPNDLPQFRWIYMLLGNLKTGFNGTFHAFNFDKYARRHLSGFRAMPCTQRDLRVVEAYGKSRNLVLCLRLFCGRIDARARRSHQRSE